MKKIGKTGLWRAILSASTILLSASVGGIAVTKEWSGYINKFLNISSTKIVETGDGNEDPIHYKSDYNDYKSVRNHARDIAKQVQAEGTVLRTNKNNALPLNEKAKVTFFGYNQVDLALGGTGSGGVTSSEERKRDLVKACKDKIELNRTIYDFYKKNYDEKRGFIEKTGWGGKTLNFRVINQVNEINASEFDSDRKASYNDYSDAAIFVLTRIGGEGTDLKADYLSLTEEEKSVLEERKNGPFKKRIVLVNTFNAPELGFLDEYNIDSCLYIGGPGEVGLDAVTDILVGKTAPSGHLADTYAYDVEANPSRKNFGNFDYANKDAIINPDSRKYLVYQEGIYVGYRYYETRAAVEGETWYQNNVVYPFGYGLSYTSFSYELVDQDSLPTTLTTEEFKVKVKVTNTGTKAGKAVAQLYGHAPYYAGKIEKSEVQLVDFGKTSLLEPGASEVLELNVNPYYMASYDYKDQNGDDFKGYTLDSGDYTFSVRTDAHTLAGSTSFQLNLPSTIKYEKDPVTDTVVKNLYTDNKERYLDSDYHLQTLLSRSDFNGTFPVTPTGDDYKLTQAEIKILEDRNPNNPNTYEMPNLEVPEEDADLMLYDLFEKNEDGTLALDENGRPYVLYDNPKWESLLNKVSLDKAKEMMNRAAFHTIEIPEIDKPRTYETDGPAGIVNFMFTSEYYGCAAYCSETLVGMTFNQELAEEWGETVGEESLWGDITTVNGEVVTKAPYSGWYAPGVNIHRSPFGGRNFEYYSEDPVHTGKMAAAEIRGTRRKGMYTFMKHFALNEQETHRSINGDISYCTEQAMREIYLKAFEIAVKEGKSLGIMSSFNRIGLKWTGGDYRLLTTILRDEWGFRGAVIDDFNTPGYMPVKQMCYAGGDLNLSTTRSWSKTDWNNANDVTVIRKALKNTLYVVANSNNMNGHGEGIVHSAGKPIYKNIQLAVNIVLPIIIIGWGAPVIILVARKKEEPVNVGE